MAAETVNRRSAPRAPLVVRHEEKRSPKEFLVLLFAGFSSAVFHAALIGLLILITQDVEARPRQEPVIDDSTKMQADDPKPPESKDPLLTTDIDPAAIEPSQDIMYDNDRVEDISVPGLVNPNESAGITDSKEMPPTDIPAPPGFNPGQGAVDDQSFEGASDAVGEVGGYNPKAMALAGSFNGRSGATKMKALIEGGGTKETEAAVVRGLRWLLRIQEPNGSWRLDGNYKDSGDRKDEIAGTAFGLLPLLGAGYTHRPKGGKLAPYNKPIERALLFLMLRQDKKSGNFGGSMYSHGLAAIAMCEAYGLSQDPRLRRSAQMAVNYIVRAQHAAGGWRYSPGQAGDTSVVGWQVMALKSAQMSGLDVPARSLDRAVNYLNSCMSTSDYGYGYTGPGSRPTMTAVGLLLRVYLQKWGSSKAEMAQPVNSILMRQQANPNSPSPTNMYYYYYATQVLHHYGGPNWKTWNNKMREVLVKTQFTGAGQSHGSWSPARDSHGAVGGRLMTTSFCLMTLEVYYRHLPLYYREKGAAMDAAVNR